MASSKKTQKNLAAILDDEDMKALKVPRDIVIARQGEPDPEPSEYRYEGVARPHLSFSQLGMFLRCSYQYFFRYILGEKERPKVSMALGSGGHTAIEFNAKRKIARGTDAPLEEVLQVASDQMDRELSAIPESEYEKDVEPGSTKDRFLAATKVYRTRDAPDIRPIAAEYPFELDLNPYIPEEYLEEPIRIIKGKIDLLAEDRTKFFGDPESIRILVTDNKFSTSKKGLPEVNTMPQLTVYNSVIHQKTGKWPTKSGLTQFHPGSKENAPDAVPLWREDEHMTPAAQMTRMKRVAFQFAQMERAIRHKVFIPTDNPIVCSWCGFRDRCQKSLVTDLEAAIIRAKEPPTP